MSESQSEPKNDQLRKLRIPLLVALVVSLGLGLGLGWKLRRDRAAQLGVVTSSRKLRILALSGSLPPQIIRGFKSAENIEVELSEEPTPDAITTHLDADSSFDLVTLLTSQTSRALQNSKIQPLKDVPGFEKVSRDFVDLPEKAPSAIPFLWGLLGFVYNPDSVVEVKSWANVFDLDRETQIVLKPLAFDTMRLAKIGMPSPVAENALQDRIRRFNSAYKKAPRFLVDPKLEQADGNVVEVSFSEATLPAYKEMKFVLPDDRALMWVLNLALGAQAKNLDEARLFAAYVLKPETALEISSLNHEASTNVGVEGSGLLPTQKPSSLRRIPLTMIDLQFNDLKN